MAQNKKNGNINKPSRLAAKRSAPSGDRPSPAAAPPDRWSTDRSRPVALHAPVACALPQHQPAHPMSRLL